MHFCIPNLDSLPLTSPYLQAKDNRSGKMFDFANRATVPVTATPANYTDTVMAVGASGPLVFDANSNSWDVTIPPELPSGEWVLLIKDSASPSNADLSVDWGVFQWSQNANKLSGHFVGRMEKFGRL